MSHPVKLVILFIIQNVVAESSNLFNSSLELETGAEFLQDMNSYLKNHYYRGYLDILENIAPTLVQTHHDHQCVSLLSFALANPLEQRWTSELLDASGSMLAPATFSGTITSFGDFDQCLQVENVNSSDRMQGKYCFVTISLPRNRSRSIDYRYAKTHRDWSHRLVSQWIELDVRFPLARSICIPSVCRESFVKSLIVEAFKPLNKLNVNVEYCQTKDDSKENIWRSPKDSIVVSLVFGFVFVLIAIGTLVDIWKGFHSPNEKCSTGASTALLSFSIIANTRSLFTMDRKLEFAWIDGFRCIFTILMLLSHVSVNQSVLQLSRLSPFAHFPFDYERQAESLVNRYLINSTFIIKTFFMISGFLSGVSMCRRRSRPSFVRFALTRWLRFTPALIGYIGMVVLLGLIGTGPLFHKTLIEPYTKPCSQYLWMQMLYINNWFDFRYSCGFQTWSISADFQLYLLSYIVLIALGSSKWKRGLIVPLALVVSSYIIAGLVFMFSGQGVPAFLSVIYPQLDIPARGYLIYWTATHNHLEAYFLGIIVGILVAKKIVASFSRAQVHVLWYASLAILFIVPHFFPWFLKSKEDKFLLDLVDNESWFDAVLMTSCHVVWLICFAWLFYASAIFYSAKTSNLVLQFLSADILAPFARLSFCVYLVHVPITWFNVHQARFPQTRDEFGAVQFTLLTYANSIAAAIFLYICFESPFSKLASLLLAPRKLTNCKKKSIPIEVHEMKLCAIPSKVDASDT